MNNIVVHRPVLSKTEHDKRMQEIKNAAAQLYIATEKKRKESNS